MSRQARIDQTCGKSVAFVALSGPPSLFKRRRHSLALIGAKGNLRYGVKLENLQKSTRVLMILNDAKTIIKLYDEVAS